MTVPPVPIDACDPHLYDDPWATYRWLRDEAPMHRDERNGLVLVSRHADVVEISRHPERYCSRKGVRPKGATDISILAMDDPEHTRLRRLVNRGFTPRQVRRLVPHVRDLARQIVAEVQGRGEVDFVADVAIHVPLIVIAELLGLDPETRLQLYRWSDEMTAGDGRTDPGDPVLQRAGAAFGDYVAVLEEMIERRRREPGDDLISILTRAYDDGELATLLDGTDEPVRGEEMEEHELLMFLVALLVAGNETTRNAISGGLLALSRFPEERERLVANLDDDAFMDLAVDEIIRYVSPVIGFVRTVTEDHTYVGEDFEHEFRAGDRVLLLYQSANRDERVFADPDRLVLDRSPNPHVAFGIGTHYCLGANLARMEVKVVFQELFARLRDIRVPEGATATRGESTLVIALEHLPAIFTPAPAVPVA